MKFSRWITPAQVQIRFDTHFFLAPLPPGQEPAVDGEEVVELGWFTPQAALDAHAAQRIVLVFPTIKHLEQLSAFATVDELLAYARERDVQPGRAEGAAGGRGRARAAAGRSRLLSRARQLSCCAAITCVTALISARCVNAWG